MEKVENFIKNYFFELKNKDMEWLLINIIRLEDLIEEDKNEFIL